MFFNKQKTVFPLLISLCFIILIKNFECSLNKTQREVNLGLCMNKFQSNFENFELSFDFEFDSINRINKSSQVFFNQSISKYGLNSYRRLTMKNCLINCCSNLTFSKGIKIKLKKLILITFII